MENILIEAIDKNHGEKIIQYFKSIGVNTRNRSGSCNKKDGDAPRFYGIIDGEFNNYRYESEYENYIKVLNSNFTLESVTHKITSEQAQSIIDIACDSWKKRLFKIWGEAIVFKSEIFVNDSFYKEMRNECTSKQHKLFDEIFGVFCDYKDGEACLVTDSTSNGWNLRYSDGKGNFYIDGKNKGMTTNWEHHRKLDINNLPINN